MPIWFWGIVAYYLICFCVTGKMMAEFINKELWYTQDNRGRRKRETKKKAHWGHFIAWFLFTAVYAIFYGTAKYLEKAFTWRAIGEIPNSILLWMGSERPSRAERRASRRKVLQERVRELEQELGLDQE